MRLRGWKIGLAAGACMLGGAAPAHAPLIALQAIESGQWQLKEVGSSAAPRSICLADPRTLLQLRHAGAQCARFVIDDTATTTTVHYTCPGAGHGRTTITIETARLVHLQTQGIADGAPFDSEYEMRRLGTCIAGVR